MNDFLLEDEKNEEESEEENEEAEQEDELEDELNQNLPPQFEWNEELQSSGATLEDFHRDQDVEVWWLGNGWWPGTVTYKHAGKNLLTIVLRGEAAAHRITPHLCRPLAI